MLASTVDRSQKRKQPNTGPEERVTAPCSSEIQLVVVSGDNEASARRIGRKLGIREIHAGLNPLQKLEAVEAAREAAAGRTLEHRGVIMVSSHCPL